MILTVWIGARSTTHCEECGDTVHVAHKFEGEEDSYCAKCIKKLSDERGKKINEPL